MVGFHPLAFGLISLIYALILENPAAKNVKSDWKHPIKKLSSITCKLIKNANCFTDTSWDHHRLNRQAC